MNMNNLFSYLKENTYQGHRALERSYPFNTYFKADNFNAVHYAKGLQTLGAFHRYCLPFCASLSPSLRGEFDPQLPIQLINQDLAALLPANQAPIPFAMPAQKVTFARALACTYVILGSSMGGNVIRRWLKSHHPNMPMDYYSAMASLGETWPQWQQTINTYLTTNPVSYDDVGEMAKALFLGLQMTGDGLRARGDATR
ncbi:hypothetical protein [Alteromonas sp. 14N.309.X.WAT.G.H12]|uniref:hypothetical protein n=1 Tax=Alteromonas sp. 14N.309.X.WAT.G.H12 TaxID=3120824 RepID=UPI002FD3A781